MPDPTQDAPPPSRMSESILAYYIIDRQIKELTTSPLVNLVIMKAEGLHS